MSLRRIAFINEKGGTCKTTLAVNTAAWLASQKKQRVLVVDLDTQGHAGKSLGLDVRSLSPNVFEALTDPKTSLDAVIHPTAVENLSVLPAYKNMSEFAVTVAAHPRRAHLLADRVAELEGRFDVVVFDSPPSLGLTTLNVLVASDEVVVPVALTYFALDGCAEVVETVKKTAAEWGRTSLRVSRVVPTLYRKTALADAILEKLQSYFPETVSSPLGFNVKIDEAQSHGQTIFEYAPRSRGAEMLATIAQEIDEAGKDDRGGRRVA